MRSSTEVWVRMWTRISSLLLTYVHLVLVVKRFRSIWELCLDVFGNRFLIVFISAFWLVETGAVRFKFLTTYSVIRWPWSRRHTYSSLHYSYLILATYPLLFAKLVSLESAPWLFLLTRFWSQFPQNFIRKARVVFPRCCKSQPLFSILAFLRLN